MSSFISSPTGVDGLSSPFIFNHLLKLLNNRHHFHARIVPHSCNIFARRPSSAQIQEFCELIFVLPVGCIISNHQVLEISKEHREKREERTTLRIAVKIIYYLICLEHIAADDGTSQLEGIEVFRSPLFLAPQSPENTPAVLLQKTSSLSNAAEASRCKSAPTSICHHLGSLGFNGCLTGS